MFHNQADDIRGGISRYETVLLDADLPNLPFHSEPLLNGHKAYSSLSIEQRKKMLVCFASLVRHLPIQYDCFVYKSSEFADEERHRCRMERDIARAIRDRLDLFQSFDDVKVYYDNGQQIVKEAIYAATESELSSNVVIRRKTTMTEYRLSQVADYFCTIELAALKYEANEAGETYNKFFGGVGAFKRNWLKQARRKRLL